MLKREQTAGGQTMINKTVKGQNGANASVERREIKY